MADLVKPIAPAEDPQVVYDMFRAHNSGLRVHTNTTIQAALLSQYPSYTLTSTTCDLISYAQAGHAVASLNESPRQAGERDQAGSEATEALVLAASIWSQQIHEQVWVYDQGRWSKDEELWRMVQGGSWKDVIMEESTKRAIMRDVIGFFDARETYAEFGTVWKRGLIFHGSPGNGKTSTAKALMKALMKRPRPVTTLDVKTLAQRSFGPQKSVRQIFTKARQTAPCLLLVEDVDSLVTDQVRSYFFNEVDGLEDNEGILMIGSTNHPDEMTLNKLDAGLSKRPSRFDRKYRFENPSFEDRVRYCEYWSKKLSSRPAAATPSTVPHHIASITDGFSFAYMKEAFVASLLTLVQDSAEDVTPAGEEDDREWGRFGNVLQKQVVALREDLAR
ncbi:MAG: hypothetical protein ASARMPRED_006081 [Alectoria sarmentosa]|nr:MAG: hypothetical protein ASARMPRED_006081 [Alectoria sarmentosa]